MNRSGAAARREPAVFPGNRDQGDTAEVPVRGLRAVGADGTAGGAGATGAYVRSFGELELAIMDLVWAAPGPLHPGEVQGRLRPGRDIAYTTVLTVMTRLHAKGWLARRKDGRRYGYWPTVSRPEYAAGLMSQALAVGGDDAATLAHFARLLSLGGRQQLPGLPGWRLPAGRRTAAQARSAPRGVGRRAVGTA